MKVLNIHQREYEQPPEVLSEILETLSSPEDRLWPHESWVPMTLNHGLTMNSSGGHGPIGYYVSGYSKGKSVEFTFTRPKGFIGTHKFDVMEISAGKTVLRHTIDMKVDFKGFFSWHLAIKWLHDALLEDALDKVHNQLSENQVKSPQNFWVTFLRKVFRKKK